MPSHLSRHALLAGLVLVAGCERGSLTRPAADAPAGQITAAASASAHSTSTASLTSVIGLQRKTQLANDISVGRTIGVSGGTLSIPAAGVTIVIPAGALSQPTRITMTARAGALVAYDFAPHGIRFAKPIEFTQELSGTQSTLLDAPRLELGYYANPRQLGTTTAEVSELVGTVVDTSIWSLTAPIHHFSGYMVTCGRGGSDK